MKVTVMVEMPMESTPPGTPALVTAKFELDAPGAGPSAVEAMVVQFVSKVLAAIPIPPPGP